MRFFTYTYNKSTSLGGIEAFVRFLQNQILSTNNKAIELYHSISCDDVTEENPLVTYYKLQEGKANGSLISRAIGYFSMKINSYNYLKSELKNDCLIIFHPNQLNFISKKTLKNNKVVLVQTNKINIFFNFLGNYAFLLNNKYIDYIAVYTAQDKLDFCNHYPKLLIENKIISIPRPCKIKTKINEKVFRGKKLVSIARIEEDAKNFSSMCKIISLLPNDVTLDVYGDGTEKELIEFKALISTEPRINYRGITKDVARTLEEYSVFIMTSHYEGFGQTLIEARSQGLPLIVFGTFSALPTILEHGKNGFIIKPYDHQAFADSILDILNSVDLYETFSSHGLFISSQTEEAHVAMQWKKLINDLSEIS